MNELDELRQKIDAIDKQLLPLFLERMEICSQVADYKRKVGMEVLDAGRERRILENKMQLVEGEREKNEVYEFYHAIMSISRARQAGELEENSRKQKVKEIFQPVAPVESPTVVFQGSPGAYSEEAAVSFFGEETNRFCVKTFADAFEALKTEQADYAVLPIENSYSGTIVENMDLLEKYSYFIVGEINIPIRHYLMGLPGTKLSDIQKVYSHEQGIIQSSRFLKSMPDVTCEAYYNTAMSAKLVAESGDKHLAAVAGKRNAKLYGLSILAENIQDSDKNTTRFVVVAKKPQCDTACDKVSCVFTLRHESGELHRVLAMFAHGGLNLIKLESRPIHHRNFEYMFFVDYTGNLLDNHVAEITDNVIVGTQAFKLLGNYKSCEDKGE